MRSVVDDSPAVYTISKISGTTVSLTEDPSRACRAKGKVKAPVAIAVDTSVLADLYEAELLLRNVSW